MTHGTVCTSILAEKFEDANITAVSLWDSHMEISLEEVCSAFQLFEKSNFKCICLSIGIHNWIHLHALYNITQRIVSDGIQIISSGSNDEKITFPAAYPWVLGVKYMPYISGIKRIYKSEDGCDIATGFFKSQVLEKLSIRNSFLYFRRCSSRALGVRVQIDVGRFGRDTSDTHRDLCRNDKMNDYCCILDTKCGMISS